MEVKIYLFSSRSKTRQSKVTGKKKPTGKISELRKQRIKVKAQGITHEPPNHCSQEDQKKRAIGCRKVGLLYTTGQRHNKTQVRHIREVT